MELVILVASVSPIHVPPTQHVKHGVYTHARMHAHAHTHTHTHTQRLCRVFRLV